MAGGRERRRGTGELIGSTPRPRAQRALAAWLPVAAWPALAYVPAVAAFGGLSMRATSGPALFGVLTAAIPTVAAYAALGFAAGWHIPGRFTAPVAGTAGFIILAFLGARVPPGFLSTIPQPASGTIGAATRSGVALWDRPVWWFAAATTAWFAALAAALLIATMARRRWLAAAPLALAALVAVPMVGAQMWRIDTTSPLLACSTGAMRVCVPNATGVPPHTVAHATRPVRARLAGLASTSRAYIWPQRGGCYTTVDQVRCDPRSQLHPTAAGHDLAQRTAGWKCPDSPQPLAPTYTSPAPRLEAGVRAWLLGRAGDAAPQAAQYLAALPKKERHNWLDRYLTAADTCDTSTINTPKPR